MLCGNHGWTKARPPGVQSASRQAARIRLFSAGRLRAQEVRMTSQASSSSQPPPPPSNAQSLDPNTVSGRPSERLLISSGSYPIGSRRRRAALATSRNVPFEQLPYQCFQEARKVLSTDRNEKLERIRVQRERIERLRVQELPSTGNEEHDRRVMMMREHRLESMRKYLQELKILADINDPLVKKRFEDGKGKITSLRRWHDFVRLLETETVLILRRHEPTYLPTPRRPQMALAKTSYPDAAPHADECRPRLASGH